MSDENGVSSRPQSRASDLLALWGRWVNDPPPPLQGADAIFLGRQVGQTASGTGMLLDLEVDVSIFGNSPDGSQAQAFLQDSPVHEQRFRTPQANPNVFFLQKAGAQYLLIPVTPEWDRSERSLVMPDGFDAKGLAQSTSDKQSKILKIVQAHLLRTDGIYSTAESVAGFLGTYSSPDASAFLAQLARSKNQCLVAISVAATILSGDLSALDKFGTNLPWNSSCPALIALPAAFQGIPASDTAKIRRLATYYLAASESRGTDMTPADNGALEALCAVHTRETIPYLLTAINSENPLRSARAMAAVGAFIKTQPAGTLSTQSGDPLTIVVEHTNIKGMENPNWNEVISRLKAWYQDNAKLFSDLPAPKF